MTTVLPAVPHSVVRDAVAPVRMGQAHASATKENTVEGSTVVTSPASDWERVVTELVAQRGAALERYAYLLCGNPDDAADLVQDALVKTFGRLRNGFTVSSAEAYVRKAVLNAYLDRGRRRSLWRRVAHLEAAQEELEAESPSSDLRLDLDGLLRGLFPRERACVVLRYYEDLKVDDIAKLLGISSGAVKRYVSDALAKLAVSLEEGDELGLTESKNRRADAY